MTDLNSGIRDMIADALNDHGVAVEPHGISFGHSFAVIRRQDGGLDATVVINVIVLQAQHPDPGVLRPISVSVFIDDEIPTQEQVNEAVAMGLSRLMAMQRTPAPARPEANPPLPGV